MSHNYAADSTFQDVMSRLAGTNAPFSAVWPTIKGAILSGRAMTVAEYRPLNALISEAHATRIARNEALNAPHFHSTVGEVAHSIGVPDEPESAPVSATATVFPAESAEKVQKEAINAASGSGDLKAPQENASTSPDEPESKTAASEADEKKLDTEAEK